MVSPQLDPIRVLSHEGLIKGLSWDPTGRYIASQVNILLIRNL